MSEKALPPVPDVLADAIADVATDNRDLSRQDAETASSDTTRGITFASQDIDGEHGARVPGSPPQSTPGLTSSPNKLQKMTKVHTRRPLVFHRSLTSPASDNAKIGALRHPSQALRQPGSPSQQLGPIAESIGGVSPFAQFKSTFERRRSEPRSSTQRRSSEERGDVPLAEDKQRKHSMGDGSPPWSDITQGSEKKDRQGLVTYFGGQTDGASGPGSLGQKSPRGALSKSADSSLTKALEAQNEALFNTKQMSSDKQDLASTPPLSEVQSLLADVLQLPITTLLQLIPPHLLDPTHERLSASSLQVPVTSVQALLESCRTLNWLCSNLGALHHIHQAKNISSEQSRSTEARAANILPLTSQEAEFDVSELVQRVCDVISGQAAEKSVDIVLLQDIARSSASGNLGSKSSVLGDEGTLRFVLLKAIAQVVEMADLGATLELHLDIDADSDRASEIKCCFDIRLVQRQQSAQDAACDDHIGQHQNFIDIIEPLVQALGGHCERPSRGGAVTGRTESFRAQIMLPYKTRANADVDAKMSTNDKEARQRFLPALRLAEEPTWSELLQFVQSTLAGSRLALHGKPSTSFVRHLTSFFGSCGCDVALLSTEDPGAGNSAIWATAHPGEDELDSFSKKGSTRTAVALAGDRPSLVSFSSSFGMGSEMLRGPDGLADGNSSSALLDPITGVPVTIGPMSKVQAPENLSFTPFTFVLIDDDIDVLKCELLRIQAAVTTLQSAVSKQSHSESPPSQAPSTQAIVFFYSLLNYRPVRDAIQTIIDSSEQADAPMPEIMMVPKPCGGRRLLTALHTAWEKPFVDPFFSPIATSPVGPATYSLRRDMGGLTSLASSGKAGRLRHEDMVLMKEREHGAPMKREDRMNTMHIQLPPRQDYSKDAAEPVTQDVSSQTNGDKQPKEDKELRDGRQREVSVDSLNDPAVMHAADGVVARSLLSVQSEMEQPMDTSPHLREKTEPARPHAPERRHTNSSKKAGSNLLTPYSSRTPSSHAATSPMMTDALEYFSETAAKISQDGSSGFMIQSPDGRPAGIFFQPRTRGTSASSRTSTARNKATHAQRSSGGASTDSGRARHFSEGNVTEKANVPLISLNEIVEGARQGVLEGKVAPEMQRDMSQSTAVQPATRDTAPHGTSPEGAPLNTSGQAKISAIPREVSATQGKMYTPQVGIQSILTSDLPMPESKQSESEKRSRADAEGTAEKSADGEVSAPLALKDDKAGAIQSVDTPSPGAEQNVALQVGKSSLDQSRVSRQTPQTITGRPSAQPQSGVLIGAGFQPTKKRGAFHSKKTAKDLEVLPPIKVLIVDDNPINVKILSTWLEKRKINIGVARDGREAVREWQTGGYQLILMDLQLPVMDGIAATKEIRRLERGASIDHLGSPSLSSAAAENAMDVDVAAAHHLKSGPSSPLNMLSSTVRSSVIIVALTASVLNSDRVAALAAGCNDFLNKPVNMRWLERKVTEWGSMQYLIGFRSLEGSDELGASQRKKVSSALLHPNSASSSIDDVYRNDMGMVRRAFGNDPEKLARGVAERLHIGNGRTQKAK